MMEVSETNDENPRGEMRHRRYGIPIKKMRKNKIKIERKTVSIDCSYPSCRPVQFSNRNQANKFSYRLNVLNA